jgi:glycosyltransferase involved in cell wall biosynthesis
LSAIAYPNVSVIHVKVRKTDYLRGFLYLFNGDLWYQIIQAFRDGKFCLKFLKEILILMLLSDIHVRKAKKIISRRMKSDDIYIMAAWFAIDAIAAAKLKRKYKKVYAFSLAHSFEINPERNEFVKYWFNKLKHGYLDRITFIANKMKDIYFKEVGDIYDKYLFKTEMKYLGSINRYGVAAYESNPENFRICTCSRLVALKRIDLLIRALYNWNRGKITWTHLGGGEPLETELKEMAAELQRANPDIEVIWKGEMLNDDVHRYYFDNAADLFINISESEGLPVTIMEAASYGIPSLATDVGGTSEIVNEKNGILMPKDVSPEELCGYIEKFYILSEETKRGMRENAYLYWESNFNAEKNINAYFKEIIKSKI